MSEKENKKSKAKQKQLKAMSESEKLDHLIKASEAMLAATSKYPPWLQKDMDEIRRMFTAMKDFTNQEFERMSNLETAFTAVVADLQELKAILGGAPKTAAPKEFTGLDDFGLEESIRKKLTLEKKDGKIIIRTQWLGDDWRTVNKVAKQFGFDWIKDGKKSRWEK